MRKKSKLCLYIFIVCTFFALGFLGYFVFNPSNDNVMIGPKKFVTFTEVPNASMYALNVSNPNQEENQEYVANYEIIKNKSENKNEYTCEVFVTIDNKKIAQESYTQIITSEYHGKINCVFTDYQVTFFNKDGSEGETYFYKEQNFNGIDKNSLCCVVCDYFKDVFICDGIYHIKCFAYDDAGKKIENSQTEFDYDYQAYYKEDFLRRESFFMNGSYYDYIIESKEEFKEFIWHAILYRQNNVTFYIDTDLIDKNNISSLVLEYIDSYPEYNGLIDNKNYVIFQNNVGKLVNFNFYLDFNFEKTYKDLEKVDSNAYQRALQTKHEKDDVFDFNYEKSEQSSDRNFKIDDNENEVLVFNTEQLFMVVQYGAKPIFLEETDSNYKDEYSVVKTVYENARDELKTINNSDNLTDYQKALNIYRYICENVVYDYVTYKFMEISGNRTVEMFGNYNCFYLEGVFLDISNQYAVCDGLSKAYTLLCNIEGIDCVKVNGLVYDGNHAWNKVCLEGKWYYVDTTWGVTTYSENVASFDDNQQVKYINYSYSFDEDENIFEVFTHTYFLVKKDNSRTIEFESEIDTSNEGKYNIYKNMKYSYLDGIFVHSGDYFIESNKEFKDIISYVNYYLSKENNNINLELKFSNLGGNDFLSIESANNIFSNLDNSISCSWFRVGNIVLFSFSK